MHELSPNNSKTVAVRLPNNIWSEFELLCKKYKITKSELTRNGIYRIVEKLRQVNNEKDEQKRSIILLQLLETY